ncbi:hypothetical protein CANINC_004730 [Pichia inconspicua]|uniref:Uncharacterized protein n=1 Tax=Pichia inconspicua TaxID=52247 RepID=A0A4T0WWJ0_9ASCO|nr:hypothetical protein CANINC_004730 [[Candida] inconspicua]
MNKTLIYWPNDISLEDTDGKYAILGYKVDKFTYVVIDVIERDAYRPCEVDKGLVKQIEIIGCINYRNKKLNKQIEEYNFKLQKPVIDSFHAIIYFKPPNSWKLEYFSLDPITINIFWNDDDSTCIEEIEESTKIRIKYRSKLMYHLTKQSKPFKIGMRDKLKVSKEESEFSIIRKAKFSPSEYIKFYNTVWLMVNDYLLGNIVYGYMFDHKTAICEGAQKVLLMLEKGIENLVVWLMHSPAGFKLNNELASFFGQLIFWVLHFWKSTTLRWFSKSFSSVLAFSMYVARYGGLSMFVSFILDLSTVLFLNLNGFYIACTRLYHWQLTIISSLFRLFYGKKYNVLRNRVDSNDYEFDQLMLGIIVFSILIYLLPTVFAFYLTFVVTRLLTLYFTIVMSHTLILINHFPIVVLLLKLKNNERIPGGILFETINDNLTLKTRPITTKEIYCSHVNAMYSFNLFNLNNPQLSRNDTDEQHTVGEVKHNWSEISITNIMRRVLIGEMIDDYHYKQMF